MQRTLFHPKPSIVKTSIFLASFLMVSQMVLFGGGASFIGQSVSQSLALGVLSFYPLEALLELGKICCFAFLLCFWFVSLLECYRKKSARRALWSCGALVLLLFTMATLLRYPAMFEAHMPLWLRKSVFGLSFSVNPIVFEMLACLIIFSALGLSLFRLTFCLEPILLFFVAIGVGAMMLEANLRSYFPLDPSFKSSTEKPFVIFIAVDSLRQDSINPTLTPNLHSFLSDPQTLSFGDHHVGVPRTFPSWMEILQGKYAPATKVRHMFPSFKSRQAPKHDLILDMRAHGYEPTVISDFAGDIFGRFESGFKNIEAPVMNLQTLIRMSCDQLFPFFYFFMMSDWGGGFFPALKENPANASPHQITNKAMASLKGFHTAEGKAPFLTMFYSTAHFPYAAPWPYYSKFSSANYTGSLFFQKNPNIHHTLSSLSLEDKAQVKALYNGGVHAIDHSLGEFFQWLKTAKIWEQTLIIVTADHGEEFFEVEPEHHGHGEHLRGPHVLQVPWIIKLPQAQKPLVKEIKHLTRSIDIYPTILNLLGLPSPGQEIQGLDVSPLFLAPSPPKPLENLAAYSETEIWFSKESPGSFQENRMLYPNINELLLFDQGNSGEIVLNPQFEKIINTAKHRSLTRGDYKFMALPTESGMKYRLYNRQKDPLNQSNIAQIEPEIFQDLKDEFFSFLKRVEPESLVINEYVLNPFD